MSRGIFITGTDTGIGKTLASCLLIDALVQDGNQVIGMKPIASGAERVDGHLLNEDAVYLMNYSNISTTYEQINPYCFEPPIAPHIAAQQTGQHISVTTIKNSYADLLLQADWVVVEGVGGWNVPINPDQTVADIVSVLDIPVVLVVGMKLGCINHAILTANAIRANGNRLLGWIANNVSGEIDAHDQVLESLRMLMGCPLIAEIPFLHDDKHKLNQPINIDLNVLKS